MPQREVKSKRPARSQRKAPKAQNPKSQNGKPKKQEPAARGAKRVSEAPRSAKNGRHLLPLLASEPTSAPQAGQTPCLSCGLCCGYVAIEIEPPNTVSHATQILWYLYHQQVSIYFDGGEWMVQFETRCQHVLDDNRCAIYETRPMICREYDETTCEVNAPEVGLSFYNSGQFLKWLAENHKRVYSIVRKRYMPPEHSLDGRPVSRTRLGAFGPRFDALRARFAPS